MEDMKKNFGIESEVFSPGVLCQYVPPCPYDCFLSSKTAREVVEMSTQRRNFVKLVNKINFL
jgi:midasin (ATPase involved in ribosome maturation)